MAAAHASLEGVSVANDDDKSSFTDLVMMAITAAPVLGAMISAPIVGSGLATLAIMDSLLVLTLGH
jgi:hypothetical protein